MEFLTSIFQSPFLLFRKALRNGSYFLRTGYWHTPERCCDGFPDANFENHLKAYRFASQFCVGKEILDVGCGTGYGTRELSMVAKSVIGVDLSWQSLHYAKKNYRNSNLQFCRMNAEALDFDNRSFDFIISTENFEHLHNQQANLREMARVLRDDGMLLLATPNPEMLLGIHCPYHTHEASFEELQKMLQEFFSEYEIAENMLEPSTEAGREMKAERNKRGAVGANLSSNYVLWGKTIDTKWASNTHSFMCFCRSPRR